MDIRFDNVYIDKLTALPWPKKAGVIALVFVGVILVGYILILRGKSADLQAARARQADLTSELNIKLNDIAKLDKEEGLFIGGKKLLDRLNKALPTAIDMPEIIDILTKLGVQNQFVITTINPAPEDQEGMFQKLSIKLDGAGSYNNIANFLSSLANYKFPIYFEVVSIGLPSSISTSDPNPLLELHLTIDVFFHDDGTQKPPWEIQEVKK